MTSPTAIQSAATKRAHSSPHPSPSPTHQSSSQPTLGTASSVNSTAVNAGFRNVSACDRCRKRKNRCDQNLPSCAACAKVGVRCVGIDPITKQEIPRSYVFYLESRLAQLESLLTANNVSVDPPDAYDADAKNIDHPVVSSPDAARTSFAHDTGSTETTSARAEDGPWESKREDTKKLDQLVSNIDMVSVQGASDPRHRGSISGITFARIVFAAVKSSVSGNHNSERNGLRPSRPLANVAGGSSSSSCSTMRDSCFGLQTKPIIGQASFPDRFLGHKLVTLYFEHANPQLPILHRGEFMDLFDRAYSSEYRPRTPRELYMLNIVFAIGAGVIFGSSDPDQGSMQHPDTRGERPHPTPKRAKLSSQYQYPAEEYHAAAIVHLESFLGSSSATDRPDGFGSGLEELQAVLLLAGFALLRPVAPGLWYIIGVAVRLAIDLGLHFEEGSQVDTPHHHTPPEPGGDMLMHEISDSSQPTKSVDAREKGRREWVRDLRRRLWWCVYSLDRLVSTCVGRPFGITDQVVTTEFPSLLDDQYITRSGFSKPPAQHSPSYKHIAQHYFRLRLLQSEILQVLQHQQAQIARRGGTNSKNEYMHTELPSPFLVRFSSFRSWIHNVESRLHEWKESAPSPLDTGVQFSVQFLELNYWQAIIMLYRQGLTVPGPLAAMSAKGEASTSSMTGSEESEEENSVLWKVAEAGQRILKLYWQLHRVRLVNYTYLATHHLFMAGISFLYAVWHSPLVRSRLTLEDVDFTILAAISVLGDLKEKCPPAEACRDAFERMSKATVQMCLSTPGFGFGLDYDSQHLKSNATSNLAFTNVAPEMTGPELDLSQAQKPQQGSSLLACRQPPSFDMNLQHLFPNNITGDNLTSPSSSCQCHAQSPHQQSESAATPRQRPSPHYSPEESQESVLTHMKSGLGMNADQQQPDGMMPPHVYRQPRQQSVTGKSFAAASPQLYNTDMSDVDLSTIPGLDFLPLSDPGQTLDTTGIDLGFGPGLDFQHDWSDGTDVNIFDGFFFGNAPG